MLTSNNSGNVDLLEGCYSWFKSNILEDNIY